MQKPLNFPTYRLKATVWFRAFFGNNYAHLAGPAAGGEAEGPGRAAQGSSPGSGTARVGGISASCHLPPSQRLLREMGRHLHLN